VWWCPVGQTPVCGLDTLNLNPNQSACPLTVSSTATTQSTGAFAPSHPDSSPLLSSLPGFFFH